MVNTLVSVLSKVDGKLVEAAQTLGAKSGAIFKEIVLPLTFPGIVLGSVLVFTGTISAYVTPSLLGGNKNMMLSTLLYQQSNELMNWQSASVFAFIMILLSAGIMKLMTYLSHKVDQRGCLMNKSRFLDCIAYLAISFIGIPLIIITVTAFGEAPIIQFPIQGFTLTWFSKVFQSQVFMDSFVLSLKISVLATIFCMVIAIPASGMHSW
ncbi:ABC transporter permease subunit [Erysipelothrix piscisicarius]|uniref:ABC transporter permease subunit n=1 Tax=Erysipelothrix piscisicarius TaxID=2485784 RepID=UPI002F958B75